MENKYWTNKPELEYFIRYSLDSDKYKRYMKLYEEIERLNKINKKATKHIEILLELALEQDSENVNLIDRLKGILYILKGDDKE